MTMSHLPNNEEFIQFVNNSDLDFHEEDAGYVRVLYESDADEYMVEMRVDIRWVCIAEAIFALSNTCLRRELERVTKATRFHISDVLVSRRIEDGQVTFECLVAGGSYSILEGSGT